MVETAKEGVVTTGGGWYLLDKRFGIVTRVDQISLKLLRLCDSLWAVIVWPKILF